MEENETMSHANPSVESDGQDDSGHVSKLVQRFYFVKLWPTNPDSISLIKKKESVVEKMNQDIREIIERIEEKMSERNHLDFRLKSLIYRQREWRSCTARKGKILNYLHVALDDLCLVNPTPKRRSNKTFFMGELENHMLNSLMLHGSKNLAEEKQILRDVNIQDRDGASFKSLAMLKNTIRWNAYLNDWQKLLREIEQFQIQWERAAGNASVKEKISNYQSLRKAIKDEIKHLSDDSSENRRNLIAHEIRVMHSQKEPEAIDQVIHYDQYCSLINKVHQLAEEKGVAALEELSRSEVGKFMLEWNSNKAFREDYEKKVLHSLERRQLSRDGRRR